MDERLQIVSSRRSIRKYTEQPVSEEEKEPRTQYDPAQAHRDKW